jgi:hypothetical protein
VGFPDPLRSSTPVVRVYTAAEWTAANYHLLTGEVGVESDTGREKLGIGSQWSHTPYKPGLFSVPAGITGATAVANIVTIGQTAYDALSAATALDPQTVYIVIS